MKKNKLRLIIIILISIVFIFISIFTALGFTVKSKVKQTNETFQNNNIEYLSIFDELIKSTTPLPTSSSFDLPTTLQILNSSRDQIKTEQAKFSDCIDYSDTILDNFAKELMQIEKSYCSIISSSINDYVTFMDNYQNIEKVNIEYQVLISSKGFIHPYMDESEFLSSKEDWEVFKVSTTELKSSENPAYINEMLDLYLSSSQTFIDLYAQAGPIAPERKAAIQEATKGYNTLTQGRTISRIADRVGQPYVDQLQPIIDSISDEENSFPEKQKELFNQHLLTLQSKLNESKNSADNENNRLKSINLKFFIFEI